MALGWTILLVLVSAVILVVAVAAARRTRFRRQVDSEARALLAQAAASFAPRVERTELDPLPPPVRAWLAASGVVGRERARTVRLKQRGEFRTSPAGAWMHARAEQYFTVDPPAFVWRVETAMMGVPIAGRDRYAGGHGHMLIQAASLLNVVDAAGDKIDHGSLLRYLGELVWFPSAALSPAITWEPVDATRAKATIRDGGLAASAVFTFSAQGRVLGMQAERYLGGGADAKLTPWIVSCSDWRVFHGIEVPTRGDVGWKLASGDFTYYRWEILDLEPNRAELYGQGTAHRDAARQPRARASISHPRGARP